MSVSPPRPKGPPLNALRAFEAAARLGSFSAAALELNVSAGAVAQHVKAVEAWAGSSLFERYAQGVRLSRTGEQVLPDFVDAFDRLGEATRKLRQAAAPNKIRIAALPSVAQLWLSPRLPAIRKAVPKVSISVSALEAAPNLFRDHYDVSLFFSNMADIAEQGLQILTDDPIYPVASPDLAKEIESVERLQDVPCLEDATWSSDWPTWLKAVGQPSLAIQRGPAFSLYALALEETRNGAGVLMGHHHLIKSDLETGRLVPLFADVDVQSGRALALAAMPFGESSALQTVLELLSRSERESRE